MGLPPGYICVRSPAHNRADILRSSPTFQSLMPHDPFPPFLALRNPVPSSLAGVLNHATNFRSSCSNFCPDGSASVTSSHVVRSRYKGRSQSGKTNRVVSWLTFWPVNSKDCVHGNEDPLHGCCHLPCRVATVFSESARTFDDGCDSTCAGVFEGPVRHPLSNKKVPQANAGIKRWNLVRVF